jgi:hypothetical protein
MFCVFKKKAGVVFEKQSPPISEAAKCYGGRQSRRPASLMEPVIQTD